VAVLRLCAITKRNYAFNVLYICSSPTSVSGHGSFDVYLLAAACQLIRHVLALRCCPAFLPVLLSLTALHSPLAISFALALELTKRQDQPEMFEEVGSGIRHQASARVRRDRARRASPAEDDELILAPFSTLPATSRLDRPSDVLKPSRSRYLARRTAEECLTIRPYCASLRIGCILHLSLPCSAAESL
jgi:hypothetical protein